MIHRLNLELVSDGGFQVINLTEEVREVVKESGIVNGSVLVFYCHTTGGMIITEHEA